MNTLFTSEEKEQIRQGIQEKYAKVALNPEGNFRYPTGRKGLEEQKYDPKLINSLPESVAASYCGVGNPFSLGPIHHGAMVLDVGCGAGVDSLIAAIMVGPSGRVIGIDLVPDMVQRAKLNLSKTSLKNVDFQESSAENLNFPNESFDFVISNGAINLVPEKAKAMREIFRVLKSTGKLMIADQVLFGQNPGDTKSMVETWAG